MARLWLLVELTYDDELMHGDRRDSREWFMTDILGVAGVLFATATGRMGWRRSRNQQKGGDATMRCECRYHTNGYCPIHNPQAGSM